MWRNKYYQGCDKLSTMDKRRPCSPLSRCRHNPCRHQQLDDRDPHLPATTAPPSKSQAVGLTTVLCTFFFPLPLRSKQCPSSSRRMLKSIPKKKNHLTRDEVTEQHAVTRYTSDDTPPQPHLYAGGSYLELLRKIVAIETWVSLITPPPTPTPTFLSFIPALSTIRVSTVLQPPRISHLLGPWLPTSPPDDDTLLSPRRDAPSASRHHGAAGRHVRPRHGDL